MRPPKAGGIAPGLRDVATASAISLARLARRGCSDVRVALERAFEGKAAIQGAAAAGLLEAFGEIAWGDDHPAIKRPIAHDPPTEETLRRAFELVQKRLKDSSAPVKGAARHIRSWHIESLLRGARRT